MSAALTDMMSRLLAETVDENPWIAFTPTTKQRSFLACPMREVLFGGAAGGAKTVAMLMAAAQYVDRPDYKALLLRRTLPELELPGGLIDLSKQWWMNSPARWNEQKKHWRFPSGARIQFGYLDNYNDVFRYQGSEWDFIGPDELTQFEERMYRYLFSRIRRSSNSDTPARMRATSNPGGLGHDWVKTRFIVGRTGHFIPSKIEDNPHLDLAAYEESLAQLDVVTRAQLRRGDWDVRPEGNMFRREWFKTIDRLPKGVRAVRFWDLAATEKSATADDPDYTAGAKIVKCDDDTYVMADVHRMRATPGNVERTLKRFARDDGYDTSIRMEQEGGASGKSLVNVYARLLDGYDFRGIASRKDKVTRAQAFSAACERGSVFILRGSWNSEFLDELCAFPAVAHDDQVDAAVGAYNDLSRKSGDWDRKSMERAFGEADEDEVFVMDSN